MMSLIRSSVDLGLTKKHKTTLFFYSLSNLILKTIMGKSTTIFKFFQKKKIQMPSNF